MNKYFSLIIIALGLSFSGFAQDGFQVNGARPDHEIDRPHQEKAAHHRGDKEQRARKGSRPAHGENQHHRHRGGRRQHPHARRPPHGADAGRAIAGALAGGLGTGVSAALHTNTDTAGGFPVLSAGGVLGIAQGGTNAATAAAAANNLLPAQSAPQAGFVLSTDGAGNLSWVSNSTALDVGGTQVKIGRAHV